MDPRIRKNEFSQTRKMILELKLIVQLCWQTNLTEVGIIIVIFEFETFNGNNWSRLTAKTVIFLIFYLLENFN